MPSSGAKSVGAFADAEFAAALMVSVVLAAPPEGVSVEGAKPHDNAPPPPEHEKLTCWLKLFSGVTVNVKLPDCPDWIERLDEFEDSSKSGGFVPPPPPLTAMNVSPVT